MTHFVQPEKIEIDANERAVNEKSPYCFFVCTTFDSFLNDLQYNDEQHIRAWLFRITVNKAKDVKKSFWHRNKMPLEDYIESLPFETKEDSNLFEVVMHLPEKYRIVIHLFYYEDWNIREISEILHTSVSNVKVRLSRGRTLLKNVLKEEWADDE